jgi:hypothetical protein
MAVGVKRAVVLFEELLRPVMAQAPGNAPAGSM